MEGIQTINALKAVQSSLPAQTTIPSGELVMLYAADGTPIAKIARDDLVKAVASVMASNSQTTFSKLLGVQANGTPMGIGASDLASVLGVATTPQGTLNDINAADNLTTSGLYWVNQSGWWGNLINICGTGDGGNTRRLQVWYNSNASNDVKYRTFAAGEWSTWATMYSDAMLTNSALLSPLASALGVSGIKGLFFFTTTDLMFKDYYDSMVNNELHFVISENSGKRVFIIFRASLDYGYGIEMDYFNSGSGIIGHKKYNGTWTDTNL